MSVFVSYARQDLAAAESIRTTLEKVGRQVWIDRKLLGGQEWWSVILHEIESCDAFLLCMSPDSARSKACRLELQYALAMHRPLVTVMVRMVDPRLFPAPVPNAQYVDYTEPSVNAVLDLVSAVNSLPPPGPLPDPVPAPPPVPISFLDDFQRALEAETLPFAEQARLVAELWQHLGDEDDREAVVELLASLRRRRDIVEAVAQNIDHLLTNIATSPAGPRQEPEVVRHPVKDDGAPPREPARAVSVEPEAPPPTTSTEVHRLHAPGVDVNKLATRLEQWMTAQRMETHRIDAAEKIIVQARSAEKFKRALGAGVAFTVVLWTEGPELVVELGQAKWADKALAGAVGLLVAWPAMIPAIFGAMKQKAMPQRALEVIKDYIAATVTP